jgi:choline dehydrogenase-like flavoprotein
MLAAMELLREIGKTSALAEWGPSELYPGPAADTAEEFVEYMRRTVITYHHPVGTCKMGIDAGAVVDPELRVYGTSGLRVADASIMPAITSGNTAAPSMMIGERAAELIIAAR